VPAHYHHGEGGACSSLNPAYLDQLYISTVAHEPGTIPPLVHRAYMQVHTVEAHTVPHRYAHQYLVQ
jgi:hypothetical protein